MQIQIFLAYGEMLSDGLAGFSQGLVFWLLLPQRGTKGFKIEDLTLDLDNGDSSPAVAEMGFEPIRHFEQGILSPQRLPFRHPAWPHRLTYLRGFCKPFPIPKKEENFIDIVRAARYIQVVHQKAKIRSTCIRKGENMKKRRQITLFLAVLFINTATADVKDKGLSSTSN